MSRSLFVMTVQILMISLYYIKSIIKAAIYLSIYLFKYIYLYLSIRSAIYYFTTAFQLLLHSLLPYFNWILLTSSYFAGTGIFTVEYPKILTLIQFQFRLCSYNFSCVLFLFCFVAFAWLPKSIAGYAVGGNCWPARATIGLNPATLFLPRQLRALAVPNLVV